MPLNWAYWTLRLKRLTVGQSVRKESAMGTTIQCAVQRHHKGKQELESGPIEYDIWDTVCVIEFNKDYDLSRAVYNCQTAREQIEQGAWQDKWLPIEAKEAGADIQILYCAEIEKLLNWYLKQEPYERFHVLTSVLVTLTIYGVSESDVRLVFWRM